MVSSDNLHALARGGGCCIVCMPVHRGGELDTKVVSRRGRYREAAENLQVKEVVVGEGERRRRYVVCFNPREAERQRRHRTEVLTELEAELATVRAGSRAGHGKRVCELIPVRWAWPTSQASWECGHPCPRTGLVAPLSPACRGLQACASGREVRDTG